MSISEIIKSKRTELNLTLRELALKADISHTYLSQVENQDTKNPPSEDIIIKIANALNMSEDEKVTLLKLSALERTPATIRLELDNLSKKLSLLQKKVSFAENLTELDDSKSELIPLSLNRIPVYGRVSAGNGYFAEKDIVDYMLIPNNIKSGTPLVGFQVDGDSMSPEIYNGDYVLVKTEIIPESNDLGVFILDDMAYVKRLKKYGDVYVLQSSNPSYKEIELQKKDIHCIGKVILVQRKY